MRLLLDSHVLLWWVTDHERLPTAVGARIRDEDEIVVSVASPWELGLKYAKVRLAGPSMSQLRDAVVAGGMGVLDVSWRHADVAAGLPTHHGDPFDRMLVAQAQVERLTLVTADPLIAAYDVDTLWA